MSPCLSEKESPFLLGERISLRDFYVDGWLSTSKNMVRVFIALALAVIIMLAPIFSGEYEGVDNIILTSKYGKTKCATAKVVAGILTAILTTALIVAFNLFLARAFYGTEGLNCSILFAPSEYVEAFIPFNITCGTLLKYQILLAFTCTISVNHSQHCCPGLLMV